MSFGRRATEYRQNVCMMGALFPYIASIVFRGEGGPCPLLKSRSAL